MILEHSCSVNLSVVIYNTSARGTENASCSMLYKIFLQTVAAHELRSSRLQKLIVKIDYLHHSCAHAHIHQLNFTLM